MRWCRGGSRRGVEGGVVRWFAVWWWWCRGGGGCGGDRVGVEVVAGAAGRRGHGFEGRQVSRWRRRGL